MNEKHMNKAKDIFKKASETMINAGIDPADVATALIGVGTMISIDTDGAEETGNWLRDVGEKLTSEKPAMPIN
ncbi:MAG: hypothetical protein N0C86_21615 [Candidatus Thiodiazotropha taylori]|nr:hypothetical protein [Candidatus Thiodiazotropha taylori]MCW4328597.1 hypothetical protein [Candidatus Thiodiazotropha taylori]